MGNVGLAAWRALASSRLSGILAAIRAHPWRRSPLRVDILSDHLSRDLGFRDGRATAVATGRDVVDRRWPEAITAPCASRDAGRGPVCGEVRAHPRPR